MKTIIKDDTNFVSEVGRETCNYAGGEELMIAEDLYENLFRQKINVMDAVKQSNRLLFVDTDCITTAFYSQFLLGTESRQSEICLNLAEAIQETNQWDLVLFLEPDVTFVQDGTRNELIAEERDKYSNQIKDLLDQYQVSYECIEGDYLARFDKAKELIEEKLGITTQW